MSIPEPSVYLFYNVQAKQAQEKSKVNEQMYHIKKKKKGWNPLSGWERDQETSNCSMASVPCCRHLGLRKERKWGWVAWTAVASLLESSGR